MEIFTDDFIKKIGFKKVDSYVLEDFDGTKTTYKVNPPYGRAECPNGMTILQWNNEGVPCTYFGEKLKPNVSFSIGKDGGTRKAFNGYVYSQEDVIKLLDLTW